MSGAQQHDIRSVEILDHSVGGITYRHYAHRAPLAFRAIMTLPQPSAFSAILRGGEGVARAAVQALVPTAGPHLAATRGEASRPGTSGYVFDRQRAGTAISAT